MSNLVVIPEMIKVGLSQINNSYSYSGENNYFPYSVGLLRTYVEANSKDPGRYEFLPYIFKRAPIGDAVSDLKSAHVVGFSVYIWNYRMSCEIARRLKDQNPEVLIVFGGPQVPDRVEDFFRGHPYVDVAVHKEGEQTFLEILENYPSRDFSNIQGATFVDDENRVVSNLPRTRIRDLDEIPSPFLSGAFDDLMAANPGVNWLGVWETNRGCPFECTYCDWGSAVAAKVNKFGLERLKKEIDWFADRGIDYIFCCDANFGILPRDADIARYAGDVKETTGHPNTLFVQGTKNATERAYKTHKILADAGLDKGVTLSMQSLDPTTLRNVKRDNISLDTYRELQHRFNRDGIHTYSDIIIGLPGETYDSFTRGIDTLIRNGQHNRVMFGVLAIMPNAELSDPRLVSDFQLKTIEASTADPHSRPEMLDDVVDEKQEFVISTATLPRPDWRRTKVFAWWSALLYFGKLAQIPMMITHHLTGIGYHTIIERFMSADGKDFPIIGEINELFEERAHVAQNGGIEYVHVPEWLDIYWYVDEYVYIKLTAENRISAFYGEALRLLKGMPTAHGKTVDTKSIEQAVRLNEAMLKQPGVETDAILRLDFNIHAFFQGVRAGEQPELIERPSIISVDRVSEKWSDLKTWCRSVVWRCNQKGDYLHDAKDLQTDTQLPNAS